MDESKKDHNHGKTSREAETVHSCAMVKCGCKGQFGDSLRQALLDVYGCFIVEKERYVSR